MVLKNHTSLDAMRLRPLAKDVRIQITNQWAEQRWTQLIQDRSAAP